MKPAILLSAALGLALIAAGCAEKAEPPAPEAAETAAGDPSCPDDGPRLPGTGLCQGRAINYLDPGLTLITEAPEGCDWVMQETMFAGPDQAILYRALSCNGVTTKLDFRGGAQSSALGYETSALFTVDEATKDVELVRIFGDGDRDPKTVIDWLKTDIPEAERATCELRPAGIDGWPTDAMVIAPTAEARVKLPADEPIQACGMYGLDEDSQTFWRFFQGYAWYFQLGQDISDIDPASLTLMRKVGDGWEQVPAEGVPLPPMPN